MAEKPTSVNDFDAFLKSCPDIDEAAAAAPLRVTGTVMRSKDVGSFALVVADGTRFDVPREAVTGFTAVSGGAGARMVELTLDRAKLSAELLGKLKIPFETIKELPGDGTFKEAPWDTLKEIGGGGDTLKEQPFDTLKEIGGGDTAKEIGGGDTLKEAPSDTFKEVAGGDGTGIADTLVEGIGQPGGDVVNPALQAQNLNLNVGGGFPTLKEQPGDTLKESPFDTLKEVGGGDTLKEGPADTLKELPGDGTRKEAPWDTLKEIGGGGDTLKEQPFDTLKELGGGDTLKEGPFDTLKELNGDTVKESPFDTLKEASGGEGTGIADTLVEGIGQPGGDLVNPALQARAMAGPLPQALGGHKPVTDKMVAYDKQVFADQTVKEVIRDHKHIKEIVKEFWKEVAYDDPYGTGAADSLREGIFDPGSIVTNPVNWQQAAGGVPFILATPHQASQGAVAQQMLAAQMLAGRGGF